MQFNPYRVLKVPQDADDNEIKKAYRAMALKWHPDKNPDKSEVAEEMFESISRAYQILSDPSKRKQYDLSTPIPGRPTAKSSNYNRHVGSFANVPNRANSFQSTSFDQLYNQFYGPNGSTSRRSSDEESIGSINNIKSTYSRNFSSGPQSIDGSGVKSGNEDRAFFNSSSSHDITNEDVISDNLVGDITVNVNCTIEDIFNCATKMMNVKRSIDGKIENKSLKVTLTKGIANGTKILLKNQGNRESPDCPHNMIFVITQLPHNRLVRRGDDIYEDITITFKDAICENYEVTTIAIDGEEAMLRITEIIQPESEHRVTGRGMHRANGNARGDHVFKFHVTIPMFTTEERDRILAILK